MYIYQKSNRYFAQAADDIKDIAEEELLALGAADILHGYRGLHFTAGPKALYTINYHSRLINRALAPLVTFNCHSDRYLYKKSMEVHWEDFLNASKTFAVFASVSHSTINHSKFAALRLKDAVVDYFRERTGERPSIDRRDPDLWLNLHIENNKASISLDTSGGSLHRRGYRNDSVQAPMIETLAAAIIKHSGWDGGTPLYDPFCGSGTILCEAFLQASNIPSAFMRKKFGFERMPDFKPEIWKQVKSSGMKNISELPKGLISGSDLSAEAVKTALDNCRVIDKTKNIHLKQTDIFDIENLENKIIICNPPYGIRMGRTKDLSRFYKELGDFLKQRCCGSTAYIYFGDRKYIKNIGLRTSWKKQLTNGGLDGRLIKIELY